MMLIPSNPIVIPAQAGIHLQQPEMGPRLRGDDDQVTKIARQFEALFVAQMLKSARAASLGDDLSGQGGATFTGLADQLRAEALAAQAPLGVAKLLAR